MNKKPLRILITSHRLEGRAGVQSLVRDLARGLQNMGHSVMTYTSELSHVERVLENDVVPVAADPAGLRERPDIIHGMHHLDAMTAIAALPDVPAVYQSHGAVWRDFTPKHPRIYRYLAVAASARERMIAESNLAAAQVEVLNNTIDAQRFHEVRTPPEHPARALFYNSRHETGSPTVAAIREAARRCGLEMEYAGYHFNRVVEYPERELPRYDIVFASGIAAMEAIACGCATLVLGRTTCGELVTPRNFDQFFAANFSASSNLPPPSADVLERQLRGYSAEDVTEVTNRLRREADHQLVVERLDEIYREAIEGHRQAPPDPAGEMQAMAFYLRRLAPLVKLTDDMQERHWASSTRAETLYELRAETVLLQKRVEAAEARDGRRPRPE